MIRFAPIPVLRRRIELCALAAALAFARARAGSAPQAGGLERAETPSIPRPEVVVREALERIVRPPVSPRRGKESRDRASGGRFGRDGGGGDEGTLGSDEEREGAWTRFRRFWRRVFDSGEAPSFFGFLAEVLRVFFYAVAALAVGTAVFFIARAIAGALGRRRGSPAGEGEAGSTEKAPGEVPEALHHRWALEAAQAGDYREALRRLLLAAMSWTERRGFLRFRKGLTNSAYVRALASLPEAMRSMAVIAARFDEVFYGKRPATPERWEAALRAYESAFAADTEGGSGGVR